MSGTKDYYLVTIIGFLVGWLVLLPIKNVGFDITLSLVLGLVVGLSIFAPFAFWVFKYLARFWSVLEQFGKFAAVGTLNTLLDLGVLNLLIFFTDISSGLYFSVFKALSFLVGTTNSYFWNKFWTFQSRLPVSFHEYIRFAFFTFIGLSINVSVASIIVNVMGAPSDFNPKLWANIGAIIAVFAAMFWNFLSYRYVVFKKKPAAL